MTQSFLDFESDDFLPENEFDPDWTARIFPSAQELTSKQATLLAYLRETDSPKTKRELALALYPKAFDKSRLNGSQLFFDGYKHRNPAIDAENDYVKKTGYVIQSIDRNIKSKLNELRSDEEKLEFLRQAPLVIRVGEGSESEAFYDYHGPDAPQSVEVLRDYVEWAATHQARQSQPLEIAQAIHNSALYRGLPLLDTNFDTPDEEMEDWNDSQVNEG